MDNATALSINNLNAADGRDDFMNEELKQRIWKKARVVPGYDPNKIRKDAAGAWMVYEHFKSKNQTFAWDIEHIAPRDLIDEKYSYDDEMNLRPMHVLNVDENKKDFPLYEAGATSNDDKNKLDFCLHEARCDNDLLISAKEESKRRDTIKLLKMQAEEQNRSWFNKLFH